MVIMTLNTTPKTTDTRLWEWKKILQYYQNISGSKPRNNPRLTDSLRTTLVKLLRALQGL